MSKEKELDVAGSAGLSERLTGFAYRLGWKLICRIPESWAKWVFTLVADIAWRRQGPKVQVLEGNLRRVLAFSGGSPDVDGKELRTLSRAALRSYARYWLEVFRLPAIPVERIVSGMHINPAGEQAMFANLKAGRGVVIALPHMGNFEQAGAWVVARGAARSPPSPSGCGRNRCTRRSSGSARAWGWRSCR